MNQSEILKKGKELGEIRADYDKIARLLNEQRWCELELHLEEINKKHMLETTVYNLTHCVPPQNTKENAINCMSFLDALYAEKATSLIDKLPKKDKEQE